MIDAQGAGSPRERALAAQNRQYMKIAPVHLIVIARQA